MAYTFITGSNAVLHSAAGQLYVKSGNAPN